MIWKNIKYIWSEEFVMSYAPTVFAIAMTTIQITIIVGFLYLAAVGAWHTFVVPQFPPPIPTQECVKYITNI